MVFPKNYGANASEGYQRNLLQTIAFGKKRIQADMNCLQKIEVDALDHLFYLANTKGNLWAGRTLLFGSGPAIDGALAEEYEGMYILPLLENFNNLKVLLSIGSTADLADRVCSWAQTYEQVDRIKRLARRLRAKGFDEFVNRLRSCK